MAAKTTAQLRDEAVAYYDLCDRARRAGVPTDVDDPRSPKTVAGLLRATEAAERNHTATATAAA